jgi:hypothetical protein
MSTLWSQYGIQGITEMTRLNSANEELVRELAAFAILQGSIVWLYRNNTVLLCVLCVQATVMLRRWDTPTDRAFFLVTAALGSLAELVFVCSGVWRYANPTFLGLPVWFGVSFGLAGVIAQRLVSTVLVLWSNSAAEHSERASDSDREP